ncbi:hypothetical protein VUR80DRAFT_6990 [Thermomyces stellatus]
MMIWNIPQWAWHRSLSLCSFIPLSMVLSAAIGVCKRGPSRVAPHFPCPAPPAPWGGLGRSEKWDPRSLRVGPVLTREGEVPAFKWCPSELLLTNKEYSAQLLTGSACVGLVPSGSSGSTIGMIPETCGSPAAQRSLQSRAALVPCVAFPYTGHWT